MPLLRSLLLLLLLLQGPGRWTASQA